MSPKLLTSIFILGIGCNLIAPSRLIAETELRRSVLTDCNKAKKQLAELPKEERASFIQYLVRVLNLQDTDSKLLQGGEVIPDVNLKSVPLPPVLKGFYPARTYKAKGCAMQLLQDLTPESVVGLPELIDIASDATASETIKDSAVDAIGDLAVAGSQNSSSIPPDLIEKIDSRLVEAGVFQASRIFFEFAPVISQALLEFYESGKSKNASALHRVILQSAHIEKEKLKDLLVTDAPNTPAASLSQNISTFCRRLDLDLDSIRLIKEQLGISKEEFVLSCLVKLDQNLIKQLLQQPWSEDLIGDSLNLLMSLAAKELNIFGESRERNSLAVGLIETHPKLVAERLQSDLPTKAKESLVQIILSSGSADPQLKSATRKIVVDELLRSDSVIPESFYGFLARLTGESEDFQSTSAKIIKVHIAAKNKFALVNDALFLHESFQRVLQEDPAKTLTGLIDSLKMQPEAIPAERLKRLAIYFEGGSKDVSSTLTSILKSKDPLTRQATVQIIELLDKVDLKVRLGLLALLGDIALSQSIEKILKTDIEPLRSKLVGALKSDKIAVRQAAARILGPESDAAIKVVVEDAHTIACQQFLESIKIIPSQYVIDEPKKEAILSRIIACMREGIVESKPLARFAKEPKLLEFAKEILSTQAVVSDNVWNTTVSSAAELGIENSELIAAFIEILKGKNNIAIERVFTAIEQLGVATPEIADALKQIAKNNDLSSHLRLSAVVTYNQIAPGDSQTEEIFADVFHDDREGVIGELKRFPVEVSLRLLTSLLIRLPAQKLPLVVSAIGDYGGEAISLMTNLKSFLGGGEYQLRYAAAVALLKIDPEARTSEGILRQVLVRRESEKLIKERLPDDIRETLNKIIAEPKSRFETFKAREMLN